MANRQKGYGMSAELAKRKEAKFDAALTGDVVSWMNLVLKDADPENKDGLDEILDDGACTKDNFVNKMKDGQILCKLINVIKPGSVKKINTNSMSFKQMENIQNFLLACEAIGCKKLDLFQSVDLFEAQNVPQVVLGITALGRKAQTSGYGGPALGPAEATENKREFTEEQMRASDGIIGLQSGSNKGASQAGQNFGKTRSIVD